MEANRKGQGKVDEKMKNIHIAIFVVIWATLAFVLSLVFEQPLTVSLIFTAAIATIAFVACFGKEGDKK